MTFFMPRVMNNVYPGFSQKRAMEQNPFLNGNNGYGSYGSSGPTMMGRYYMPAPGNFWGPGCGMPSWAQKAACSVPLFDFLQQLAGMLKGNKTS